MVCHPNGELSGNDVELDHLFPHLFIPEQFHKIFMGIIQVLELQKDQPTEQDSVMFPNEQQEVLQAFSFKPPAEAASALCTLILAFLI